MFKVFLQKNNPELLNAASAAEINVNDFETIFGHNPQSAIRALQDIIKSRAKSEETPKTDKIAAFITKHKETIKDIIKLRNQLVLARDRFAAENDIRLVFEWEEDLDNFVRLGRAKRGSKMVPGRDLSKLYRYMIANKLPLELRISPSDDEPYEFASLYPDGSIKAGKNIFAKLNHWSHSVYASAVDRGTRTTVVGSPWKAVQVKNRKGDWITIDRLWGMMLSANNEVETEEDEEE